MNKELIMVFLPGISWILFALGGTRISDEIEGKKWFRRFILPAIYLAFCLIMKVAWWQTILIAGLAIGVYHLGYGTKTSWKMKPLVGVGYGLITIPIGLSWWNLVTAISFISLFKLSNTGITKKMFIWKICEGFFGLFCGIQLAYLLMGFGLRWVR